jgi:hypothetical protein
MYHTDISFFRYNYVSFYDNKKSLKIIALRQTEET